MAATRRRPKKAPRRLESIDQFRGLAILMMVLANYLGGVHSIPAWLKHSPGIGLTVIDLIAPLFIFAIGLTYRLSMRRRIANAGPGRAFAHFFERFMALLGMGSLAATGGAWLGFEPDQVGWGVLQAIGIAGLLALPLVRMPTWARLGVGLSLLALYQLLLDRYWLDVVTHWAHGGIHGSLGWAAMLILGTVLGDLFHGRPNSQKLYPWASVLTLVIGIALSVWIPVSKNRISASYVLISLGVSGVLFLGLWLLNDRLRVRLPLLSAWGQNPLLLYLLHYLLLGAFALPRSPAWYAEAPLWLMLLQLAGMLVVLSWVGVYLHRKKWILSL